MRNTILLLVEIPPDTTTKEGAVISKGLPLVGTCRYVSLDDLLMGYMGAPMPSPYHNFDDYVRHVVFHEAPWQAAGGPR